jgi:hypothetical protein
MSSFAGGGHSLKNSYHFNHVIMRSDILFIDISDDGIKSHA